MCGVTLYGRRLVLLRRTVTSVYIEIYFQKSYNGGFVYANHRKLYCCYQFMYNLLQSWLFDWEE